MSATGPSYPLIASLPAALQQTIERIIVMLVNMPQEKLEVIESVVQQFAPEATPLVVRVSPPTYQLQLVRRSQDNSVDINVDVE